MMLLPLIAIATTAAMVVVVVVVVVKHYDYKPDYINSI